VDSAGGCDRKASHDCGQRPQVREGQDVCMQACVACVYVYVQASMCACTHVCSHVCVCVRTCGAVHAPDRFTADCMHITCTCCAPCLHPSADLARLQDCRHELHSILQEERLFGATLLVLANKQDLPNAMNAAEITDKLGLHNLRGRNW